MILEDMTLFNGLNVIETSLPIKIEETSQGKKKVTWKNQANKLEAPQTDGYFKNENSDSLKIIK